MGEKNKPEVSLEAWLKKKQQETNNSRVRAEAYFDTSDRLASLNAKDTFSWFVYIMQEMNNLYTVAEMINGDDKVLDKKVRDVLASSLGLSGDYSWEQINIRAKEFGDFAQTLIERGREEKEQAKKLEKP